MSPRISCQVVARLAVILAIVTVFEVPGERLCAEDIETKKGWPIVEDEALVLELFAEHPDIVTPVAIDVDDAGRVWVIESHTHQTPDGYLGPRRDRILVFEDIDGDGRPERITRFVDGLKHAMGLCVRPDGVYVITRNCVRRFRDTNGDLVADGGATILGLETAGDYPHNGLSGIAFDELGWMYIGMGENLGVPYRLIARGGTTLSGGTEGGNVFRSTPDGDHFERWATGFWNAFGLGFDQLGRLFVVDNDPDSRPPCRLLHVVRGGDYGYRFWLGRAGLHPFTSWNGLLPGTLPMVAGTSEAPSAVVAYEHDAFPERYRGQLFGTSWGDHRIECFEPEPRGASFRASARTVVRGGEEFRPVGIALAPDGSLYFTDWVDRSYPVHGRGRIWRLRAGEASTITKSAGGFSSPSIRYRHAAIDAATAELRSVDASRHAVLVEKLEDEIASNAEPRARYARLVVLARAGLLDPARLVSLQDAAASREQPLSPEIVAAAIRLMVDAVPADGRDRTAIAMASLAKSEEIAPSVRAEALLAVGALGSPDLAATIDPIAIAAATGDPFVASAALSLATRLETDERLHSKARADSPRERLFTLVALRRVSGMGRGFIPFGSRRVDVSPDVVRRFVFDTDPDLRRAAMQWIGEEGISELRADLDRSLSLGAREDIVDAWLAASALLDGGRPGDVDRETRGARLLRLATRPDLASSVRAHAFAALDPSTPGLDDDHFVAALGDAEIAVEAVRTLRRVDAPWARDLLRTLARDETIAAKIRREAIVGLSIEPEKELETLGSLLDDENAAVRRETARALRDVNVDAAIASKLSQIDVRGPDFAGPRGSPAWRRAVAEGGDAAEGAILFFHPRGPRCASCHVAGGRGGAVGPDLSTIGSRGAESIIDSILDPAKEVAPQFAISTFIIGDRIESGVELGEDAAGRVVLGLADGSVSSFERSAIRSKDTLAGSLMPNDLIAGLRDGEIRDLVAFLLSLR
jgi:putative membrane-bound dehydrogenase-like protein